MVLDAAGEVLRPALLWNDTRSATAALDLVEELGPGEAGPRNWADAVGSVPVASFTVTKLRWIAQHEPEVAAAAAAVCLPHDWLTARLRSSGESVDLGQLTTDRSDASGTGYWSAATNEYRPDLLERAFGSIPMTPRVLAPNESAGSTEDGISLGAGMGDNAAAALGLGLEDGDAVVSIGTSGTAFVAANHPTADESGIVAGFADGTGKYLPLVCTLNAARVLDAVRTMLEVSAAEFDALALSADPGAGGLILIPYFEGERTPNRPLARGALHGVELENMTPSNLARAAVEGVLCSLADAVDALLEHGAVVERVQLIGGGARSRAIRQIAPSIFDRPIVVPPVAEYVALGAACQAAWSISGAETEPAWRELTRDAACYDGAAAPAVRSAYREASDLTISRRPT